MRGTAVAAAARATRNMSSLMSSPTTWPESPTLAAACRATIPVPQATSSTRWPLRDAGQLDQPPRPRRERGRQVALVGLGGVAVHLPSRRRAVLDRWLAMTVLLRARRAQCRMAAWAPTMTARPDPLLALAARPATRWPPDTLSDVLQTVRLTGALFFLVDAFTPWVAEAPASTVLAPVLLPQAQHIVSYHVVRAGTCWCESPGQPPCGSPPATSSSCPMAASTR